MGFEDSKLVDKYLKLTYELSDLTPSKSEILGLWTFKGLKRRLIRGESKNNPEKHKQISMLVETVDQDVYLRMLARITPDSRIAAVGNNRFLYLDENLGLAHSYSYIDPIAEEYIKTKVTGENLNMGDYSPAELSLAVAFFVKKEKYKPSLINNFERSLFNFKSEIQVSGRKEDTISSKVWFSGKYSLD